MKIVMFFLPFIIPIVCFTFIPAILFTMRKRSRKRRRIEATLDFLDSLERAISGNRALVVVSKGGLSYPFILDPSELERFTTPTPRTGVYDA